MAVIKTKVEAKAIKAASKAVTKAKAKPTNRNLKKASKAQTEAGQRRKSPAPTRKL